MQKTKKEPLRTCTICRNKGNKESFVRVVRTKEGEISIDQTYKVNGRGLYVCKNGDCIAKAIKGRALNKAFKTMVDDSVYKGLESYEHK